MTQPQHATIEVQHGAVVGVLDVHGEILEPRGLREVWFGVTDGRGEPERASMDVPLVGRVRLGHVRRDPGQRHAAAVTALGGLRPRGAQAGGILDAVPWNIRHLEQAQLLALIHVGRAGQRHLKHQRGTGPQRADPAVLHIGGAVAQQPVVGDLMVFAGRHLRQRVTRGVARHIMVAHHPGGRRARPLGARQPLVDGFAHRVEGPIRLGELEVEHLPQFIR